MTLLYYRVFDAGNGALTIKDIILAFFVLQFRMELRPNGHMFCALFYCNYC